MSSPKKKPKALSREFLLKRGYCCKSGCQNCPYGYTEKVDPTLPPEMKSRESETSEIPPEYLKYIEGEEEDFL